MTRTHLITGVAGQDGVLLARHLVASGDRVVGTVADESPAASSSLLVDVDVVEHDLRDVAGFVELIDRVRPAVVHNLAALSSVGDSWSDPETTTAVNQTAVEGMLGALLRMGTTAPAFVQASTSEIFGRGDGRDRVDERTPIAPLNPYGTAKAAAHRAVTEARAEGLRATNLILFGHSSPLHAARFVLPTIARQAAEIHVGRSAQIMLQDPAVRRDWGSARDVARAFASAADGPAGDYVIGTGHLHTLDEVAHWALAAAGLAPGGSRVVPSGAPARPGDVTGLRADARHAAETLGWEPQITLDDEIRAMVAAEIRRLEDEDADVSTILDAAYATGAR